jgi:hypothetical protein
MAEQKIGPSQSIKIQRKKKRWFIISHGQQIKKIGLD